MPKTAVSIIEEIESLLDKGLIFDAYNRAIKALDIDSDGVRLNQLYGLCLAKLGMAEPARAVLEKLYNSDHRDSETAGILARIYKDQMKQKGDLSFAYFSREIYLKSFEETRDYYPGINAATMSLVLNERPKAEQIAQEVIKAAEKSRDNYWKYATLGEARLIIGDFEGSRKAYRKSKLFTMHSKGQLFSSFEQLRFLARYTEIPASFLDNSFHPSVVVFSGHMIDHPSRSTSRFPDRISHQVKQEIIEQLESLNAGIGFSSAACGADILFIEAMLERGAEVNVYLPFAVDDFIETSVAFAGEIWVERFKRVINQVEVKYITEERYLGTDELFRHMGKVTMGLAMLTARLFDCEPYFLAVLDQIADQHKEGGTNDLFVTWPDKGKIRVIDPSSLSLHMTTQEKPPATPLDPSEPADLPFGVDRYLKCILFADLVGYSKLQEEHTPYFIYELLHAVSEKLKQLAVKPEILNTWGDAIFVVYDQPDDLMAFALALNETILETDWEAKKLPANTSIRIALHSGPVFIGEDPITNNHNAYGTHITRTARMEPVTLPGCIYASEQFAALLLVKTGDHYQYRYVGKLDLPKKFGSQEMYQVSRNSGIPSSADHSSASNSQPGSA